MIEMIWGNGKDIIIKFKRNGDKGFSYAASKWLNNNSNMNEQWLYKNGFRRRKWN